MGMKTYNLDIFEFIPIKTRHDEYALKRRITDITTGKYGQPPCDSCSAACCRGLDIPLEPNELHLNHNNGILQQGADGACSYLVNNKCSIYNDRPKVCKSFDCRILDAYLINTDFLHGKPKCVNTSPLKDETNYLGALVNEMLAAILSDETVLSNIAELQQAKMSDDHIYTYLANLSIDTITELYGLNPSAYT